MNNDIKKVAEQLLAQQQKLRLRNNYIAQKESEVSTTARVRRTNALAERFSKI